jgi:branched-chain amino acid transport system ATP-binding protein
VTGLSLSLLLDAPLRQASYDRRSPMALLELENVEARYGPIRALHGVSLAVEEGQAVALLGANGAGKTTTLRSISGTVRASGAIAFASKRIMGRAPESIARLGIAHVPEGRGIYAELTVWENVLLGGSTRRDRRAIRSDGEAALAHFPRIASRRKQQAGTLSGGEQQMLALARALVARPRLLMLDEPSLGLAPTAVQEFYRVVRHLNQEEGLTVLLVEQNARIALASTQQAYVLEVGRVAMSGTSDELSRHEGVRASYLGY